MMIYQSLSRRNLLKCGLGTGAACMFPSLAVKAVENDVVELRAQNVQFRFRQTGGISKLWFYNGLSPGPEIAVAKGDWVRVKFINDLDVPTSIHWHGIRIVNQMDGVSGLTQQPVDPGESFDYEFVAPDAGTYWYHAHHRSWEQVARGLYGALIIGDPQSNFDRAHDITLILDDWWLDEDGVLVKDFDNYMTGKQGGRIGNFFSINGGPAGDAIDVNAGEPYRLRLINAANARIFSLGLTDPDCKIIAYDGQALARPVSTQEEPIVMSPGQRVDLCFVPKTREVISLVDLDGTMTPESDDAEPAALFSFKSEGHAHSSEMPSVHNNGLQIPDTDDALMVRMRMEGGTVGGLESAEYNGAPMNAEDLIENGQVWTFNGVANLPTVPLFSVKRGRCVVLEMDNQTGWQHAMHIHGHHFRVLEANKNSPMQIWYDTYLVDRLKTVRIAFTADNPGKWLIHCHMLQHAAAGMNTWFEVT